MTLFSITDTSDYLNELSTYLLVEQWQPYRQRVHPSRQSV